MLQYAVLANQVTLKQDIIGFITLTKGICSSVRDMPEFDTVGPDLEAEVLDER